MKPSFRSRVARALPGLIRFLFMCMVGVVFILPFYWSLLTSLRPNDQIFSATINLLPTSVTLDHYKSALATIPFFRYTLNTAVITLAGLALNLIFGSLAGYAFARINFKGREIIFKIMISALMLPSIAILIPQFLVLARFPLAGGNNIFGQGGNGFVNNVMGVILPGGVGIFGVFFMRQFFLSLPGDLGEAAKVDGAGELRIFGQIYMPLTKPALATLAVFCFHAGWNSFLWPNIILQGESRKVLTQGLQAFVYKNNTDFGPLMAASILISLPVFVLFAFCQKYFIQGIALSGTKE